MIFLCRFREEFWWWLECRIENDALSSFVLRRRYRAQNDRTRRERTLGW